MDSPPELGESTLTKPPGPTEEEPMEVEPDVRRRMQGKTRTVSTDQPTAPSSNRTADAGRQETAEDHDDKRRRADEPKTPLSPVAQNEALVLNTVSFQMKTRSDEISADVPLPEEPEAMGSDQPQGWITEEAFFTVSPGARQIRQRKEVKMSQLTPTEKLEFLESMDTEWQTLLKNQAAKVLSPEEKLVFELENVGQIVQWILVGLVSGSQTTACHVDVGPRHDSSKRVSQILTSSTSNHILRR